MNGVDIFAGADTDTLTGTTTYRSDLDNTHFKSAGADAAADLWQVSVLAGEVLSPPPMWLMRQAGRYLPE